MDTPITPGQRLLNSTDLLKSWEDYLRTVQYLRYAYDYAGDISMSDYYADFYCHEVYQGLTVISYYMSHETDVGLKYIESCNERAQRNRDKFIELVADNRARSVLIGNMLQATNAAKDTINKIDT